MRDIKEPVKKNGDVHDTDVIIIGIDDVLVDQSNVRDHDERNISTIAGSLVQFGSGRSIVLDGSDIVRAGNGTVEAARQVGFKEILVINPKPNQLVAVRRSEWTPAEATGYSIADNRSTDLSRFDMSGLTRQLETLRQTGINLSSMGWSDQEMMILKESVGNLEEQAKQPDEKEPEKKEPDKTNDDRYVKFKFGDYHGPVSREVYDSFMTVYKEKQQESAEPILDDVLRYWLHV